ncbi:hypothetical protein AJ80_01235 [Polytolypa hystricis UAMH7299]|uniref:SGNH hydrolase-type esterase domain-containing protein n=1 Tax=Polytolypa hystricis (strain UAMH7299) TaxID=1447883 RepID=A0A2B7Z1D3_POLH7|nr:hypothetical protein AJ80_01235 [Polytolypa hystricis UAMH7299]
MRCQRAWMLLTAVWLQVAWLAGAVPTFHHETSSLARRQGISTSLRIMPLGDSITRGSLSTNTNGYRGPLQARLSGTTFDFIGTLVDGDMKDRSHQGHSGKFLSDIESYSLLSIRARPNVILLHGGTNDVDLQRDVSTAPERLGSIIDQLLDRCPDAVVFVAKIIGAKDAALQSRIDAFNSGVAKEVESRASSGKHVLLVDMSTILNTADLADKKHPNDSGYSKMADSWYEAILEADAKGWIGKPVKPEVTIGVGLNNGAGESENAECSGSKWTKKANAANLVRIWEEKGQIFPGHEDASLNNVIFADVTGDGIDDYLLVSDDGQVRAWRGTGTGFEPIGIIVSGPEGVDGRKVRFADLDGDGLADYIVLYDDGAAKAWRNLGKFGSTDAKKWEEVGTIAEGVKGVTGDKVQFADIDGDGLADYLIIYDGGSVAALRNTGNVLSDSSGRKWEEMGTIAPGVAGIPGSKIRFFDFDGDGLADFVIVYDGGSVEVFLNSGNLLNDKSPKWKAIGVVATGVKGVAGKNVRFANLDDDGLADFIALSNDGAVTAYMNSGRYDRAAGVRFADLNGDGRDDFLWVHEDGSADAWLNEGGSGGNWKSIGRIARSPAGATREKVVFADIDGDGRADYLILFDGGAVKGFRNNGNLSPEGGNWEDLGMITDGVGVEGRKLQFADVDGDGLADLLVIYDGGAVKAYKNNGLGSPSGMFSEIGTIATGVSGATGDKIRMTDIDGDGTADYLVVYDGGSVLFYRNNGNLEADPDRRSWDALGVIAAGVQDQGIVLFADLNGDGRSDYLNVHSDGVVDAYLNNCAWAGGSDPETPVPGEDTDDDDDDDPPEIPLCEETLDDADPDNSARVWHRSRAGVIADDFINASGPENWVQKLDNEIFGRLSDSWFCFDTGTVCQLQHSCDAYDEKEVAGAYHLYYSIQQARSFFTSFHERIQDNAIKEILDIEQVIADLKWRDSDDFPPVFALLAGAFTMISGATPFNAWVSGTTSFLGGAASFISSLPADSNDDGDYSARLAAFVKQGFVALNEHVDTVTAVLFGDDPDQDKIPAEMQKQSFDNAIVRAFGDGQWLLQNPTKNLKSDMDVMYRRVKQALAVLILRHSRRCIVLINTDVAPHQCEEQDPDAWWDEERGECFNMFCIDGNNMLVDMETDFGSKLWSPDGDYNFDRDELYANAYDCWMANDGKIGEPVWKGEPGSIPECFFGMVVVKGSYAFENDGKVTLANFPGQFEGRFWFGLEF